MEATWINKVNPKFAVDTSKGFNLLATMIPKFMHNRSTYLVRSYLAIQQVENIRDGSIKVDPIIQYIIIRMLKIHIGQIQVFGYFYKRQPI